MLEQIEWADERLWLAFFLAGLAPAGGRHVNAVMEALVRAAHRGVDVRLLVSPFESGPERLRANVPAIVWLTRRGITPREFRPQVFPDGRVSQRRSMHGKTLIRDEAAVIVGSANLTPGGMDNNHELALLVESADLVHHHAERFAWAWHRAVELD